MKQMRPIMPETILHQFLAISSNPMFSIMINIREMNAKMYETETSPINRLITS